MSLEEVIVERGKPGMVLVSDVDGVHTSPSDGVKIGVKPSSKFGALFTLQKGVEVIELVSTNGQGRDQEFSMAGFVEEETIELYQFYTPDGQAILSLLNEGVRVIVISGRNAAPVLNRFETRLGAEVFLGVKDKLTFFDSLDVNLSEVIFIADGHQDVPLLQAVSNAGGIAVVPADCELEARKAADAQTSARGGKGAFAELAQIYLDSMS